MYCRVDSGYRTAMTVQSSLVMYPISQFGSNEQKAKYLPKLAKGELIGCFALTEPAHGSEQSSIETTAKENKDHFVLNGKKTWVTNSSNGDLFIIWAKLERSGVIKGFLVEKGTKGLSSDDIQGKMSLKSIPAGVLTLNNVVVPKENMLPNVERLLGPFLSLNHARFATSWGAVGAAESCFHLAREYSLQRQQFGGPIARFQLIQEEFAEIQTEIALALESCLTVGRLMDHERASAEMISLIKRNSCQKALEVARKCRDIFGGNGIHSEYHVMRHVTNLEAVITNEGTNSIHSLILGKEITGIPAFKPNRE